MVIEVRGLRELDAALAKLGSQAGTRIVRRAMLLAADPIVQDAKQRVAAWAGGSGALHEAISRRFLIGRKASASFLPELGGVFTVQVAPFLRNRTAIALHNLYYGRRRKGIFYGHLLEFGHRIGTRNTGRLSRRDRESVSSQGRVAAKPFLGPALRARQSQAVQIMAQQIRLGIERALRRRGRNAK